jgi:predicted GTPase
MTSDFEITRLLQRFKDRLREAENRKFTFVLAGRAGVGKSSTINTLMGQVVAKVGHYEACTSAVRIYESAVNGLHFRLVDTPGLCETERVEQDEYYLQLIRTEVPTVDCIWYVTQLNETRVRKDERDAIELISRSLGSDLWRNALIIFTHADLVPPERYEVALNIRTRLIREEIAKHSETMTAHQVPSVAVSNVNMQTPDGELWLGNLYVTVAQRISQSGLLPFFLATAPRVVSAKPDDGDTYVIHAPNAESVTVLDMSPSVASYIPLTKDNEERLVRQLDASVIPGLIVAGSTLGTVFGPIGVVAGGVIGAAIGLIVWLMRYRT